jgi:hypothetical protein
VKAAGRNNLASAEGNDSRLDSNDSITKFFFTDSFWGLRLTRLKLFPCVAASHKPDPNPQTSDLGLITR